MSDVRCKMFAKDRRREMERQIIVVAVLLIGLSSLVSGQGIAPNGSQASQFQPQPQQKSKPARVHGSSKSGSGGSNKRTAAKEQNQNQNQASAGNAKGG